jgi:hypothetical protein
LSIGYRIASNANALDISVSYAKSEQEFAESDGTSVEASTEVSTFPKLSYLRYLTPTKEQSWYMGAGLAFGNVRIKSDRTSEELEGFVHEHTTAQFTGFMPNATLGMEFGRSSKWKGFAEAEISQPLLPAVSTAETLWSPIVQLSLGAGF